MSADNLISAPSEKFEAQPCHERHSWAERLESMAGPWSIDGKGGIDRSPSPFWRNAHISAPEPGAGATAEGDNQSFVGNPRVADDWRDMPSVVCVPCSAPSPSPAIGTQAQCTAALEWWIVHRHDAPSEKLAQELVAAILGAK